MIFSFMASHLSITFCFIFLLGFGISFLAMFCLPWIRVSSTLAQVTFDIEGLKEKGFDENLDKTLDKIFNASGVLENIWKEFKDTLHKQTEIDSSTGQQRVVRMRLTAPAEVFFRTDIIVDTPLRADFFKHLPGILTGIGIIGTFVGILSGLQDFEITDKTEVVQLSLKHLLTGVSDAFFVSATAITSAIVITLFEKIAITQLNAKVEKLTQLIDGLFEAGAGEEYLSRLVKSSEASASHAGLLKDALVGELKQILSELTAQQIAATNATQQQQLTAQRELTEQHIAATNSLLGPLEKIREELGGERQDNGTAVQNMLTDIMAAFTDQIKDLFGNQLQDISSLQQQTISALQTTVTSMETMVTRFGTAGTDGATDMAKTLTDAMNAAEIRQQSMNDKITALLEQVNLTNNMARESGTESAAGMAKILTDALEAGEVRQQSMNENMTSLLEQIKIANIDAKNTGSEGATDMAKILTETMKDAEIRQQSMNTQMADYLEQIKLTLNTTQDETQDKLQESLSVISTTMTTLLDSLGNQSGKITAEGERVVGDFGNHVQSLANGVNEAVVEMKKTVESMRTSTNDALTKMNASANTLSGAATEFAKAGQGVVGTLDKSKTVSDQLSVASGAITSVTSGLTEVLSGYKSARDSMSDLVGGMKLILEQARKEASMSDDVLKRIEVATGKLIAAQHEADGYLTKVTEVIKTSHSEFTSGMTRSLNDLNAGIIRVVGDANSSFHHDLTTAVGLLKGGISEFSEVFEEAADKVTQAANRADRR
jgi:hypothetical protein